MFRLRNIYHKKVNLLTMFQSIQITLYDSDLNIRLFQANNFVILFFFMNFPFILNLIKHIA